MAKFEVKIPDAQAARVMDAICEAYGYRPEDGPKPKFVRAKIAEHIKGIVRGVEETRRERELIEARERDALDTVDVS